MTWSENYGGGWSKMHRITRGRVGAELAPSSTMNFAPCHIPLKHKRVFFLVSHQLSQLTGLKGVSPGQKALIHGNKFCFNFNEHHPFSQINFPCWALLFKNFSQNLVFCPRVSIFYSIKRLFIKQSM